MRTCESEVREVESWSEDVSRRGEGGGVMERGRGSDVREVESWSQDVQAR